MKENEKVEALVTTAAEDILKFVEEVSNVHAAILVIPDTAVQPGVAKDSSSYTVLQLLRSIITLSVPELTLWVIATVYTTS